MTAPLRIREFGVAIELGHRIGGDAAEPSRLAAQCERNIANKEAAIDRPTAHIAYLKAQRDELDRKIAGEDTKMSADTATLG